MEKIRIFSRVHIVFISTMICGFLAHAYCYFNLNFSHDSVLVSQQFDYGWQIAIGRWMQPVYCIFRGDIYNPFLVGCLSLFFLAVSCYLLVLLLDIKKYVSIFLIAGILSVNAMLAYANATYIYLSDIYMLALLLAVGGVYVYKRCKFGFVGGAALFALSLALYQSFIQVAVLLFFIFCILDLIDNTKIFEVIKKGVSYVLCLVLGGGLYFIGFKFVLLIMKVESIDSYNTVSKATLSGDVFSLIIGAYQYFFDYFINPSINNAKFISWLTILFVIVVVYAIGYIVKKRKTKSMNKALVGVGCVLLPLVSNFVYVITKGMEHELMIFSFFVLIALGVALIEWKYRIQEEENSKCKRGIDQIVVYGFSLIFIINSIIFSNEIYTKKDLEFKTTYATLNRIIDRIEQLDGYEVNETPVVFIGNLENSSLAMKKNIFEYQGVGQGSMFAVTYDSTYEIFMENVMGYPIKMMEQNERDILEMDPRIKEMDSFPAKEACKMIDGIVVVKLSDQ